MFKSDFSGRNSAPGVQPVTLAIYKEVEHPRRFKMDENGRPTDECIDNGGWGKQIKDARKVLPSEVDQALAKWPNCEVLGF